MTRPTPAQIAFSLQALSAESGLWARQSDRFTSVIAWVSGLSIGEAADVPEFAELISAYDEVRSVFIQRCTEGGAQTGRVADQLRIVASVYAQEEAANIHAQRNLY